MKDYTIQQLQNLQQESINVGDYETFNLAEAEINKRL